MAQAPKFLTQVGIKKETIYGTGVNPTSGIAVNEVDPRPRYEVILDNGLRGLAAADYKSLQGAGGTDITMGGFVYPEEIGHLLLMIMGTVATVGGGAPYTHTFTMGASPGSLTLETDTISGASGASRFTGVKVGQLAFHFNAGEGALTYDTTMIGKIPTKVTAQNPARVDNNPWQGWRSTITSTGMGTRIISGNITLSRDLQPVYTATGSQDVKYLNSGPLKVEGDVVLAAEDMTDFDNFLTHLTQSFQLVLDYGSGASQKTITFLMTSCNFGNGPLEIGRGDIGVTFGMSMLGLYNATDAGPIKVTLLNAASAY